MAALGVASAIGLSVAFCGLARFVGLRLEAVDRPDDDLKTHARPVVPLGGAGVIVGVNLGLVAAGEFDPALLLATSMVWVLGLVDDVRGLSPLVRLVGASLAGVSLVTISSVPGGILVGLFWVLATVVMVNAVNLLDGMDGLVAVVSILALSGLGWFAVLQGRSDLQVYLVAAGALVGFLVWNFPPARMFLGDNGAYVVGVMLSWGALHASPEPPGSFVALAIVGVPLLDLAITIGRRLATGHPLFSGDRDHTYDRMHFSGRSVKGVLAVFAAGQLIWVILVVLAVSIGGLVAGMATALGLGGVIVWTSSVRRRAV